MGTGAKISGDRRVRQLLTEMADRTRGIEPQVWAKVGDVLAEHLERQFLTEGSHLTGHPWAPLSPPYLSWKVKHGFDPRILRQTGAMHKSFTSRPFPIEQYRDMSADFASDDDKAAWHQHGTRFMPERRIIDVDANPDLADDVNSVLARYIFEERLS